jgi:RNA polymerase sigma factor (sigma-70 family)
MIYPDVILGRAARAVLNQAAALIAAPTGLLPVQVRALAADHPATPRRECLRLVDGAEATYWQLAMIAKRTAARYARARFDGRHDEELQQEALLGLYEAAIRWDPHRGPRFATYARWWVHHQLSKAIAEMHPGASVTRDLLQAERQIRRAQEAGATTSEEIARLARVPVSRVHCVQQVQALRWMAALPEDIEAEEVALENSTQREMLIAAAAIAVSELPKGPRRRLRNKHHIGENEGPARIEDVEAARQGLRRLLGEEVVDMRQVRLLGGGGS